MEDRRSYDRELGELSTNVQALFREIKRDQTQRDIQHSSNTNKLDSILGIKLTVEQHDKWIEIEGKPAVNMIKAARFTGKGVIIGATLGGGAVGAFIVKLVAALSVAIH